MKTIKATIGIAVASNGEWYAHGQGPGHEDEQVETDAEHWAKEALSVFYEAFEVPNDVQVEAFAHEIEIPVPQIGNKISRFTHGKSAEIDALLELLYGLTDSDGELFKLDEEIRQVEHRLGMLKRFREWSLREGEILALAMDATSCLPQPDASVSSITDTVTVQREVRVEFDERPQVAVVRPPAAEPADVVAQPTPPALSAEPAEPAELAEEVPTVDETPDQPDRTERKNAETTRVLDIETAGSSEDSSFAPREQRRRDRERERSRRRREQAKSAKLKSVPDECHLTTTASDDTDPVEPEPNDSEAVTTPKPYVATETARGTLHDDIRGHLTKYGGKPTAHDLARFWGITEREVLGAIGGMDDVEVFGLGYVRFKPGCEPAEAA